MSVKSFLLNLRDNQNVRKFGTKVINIAKVSESPKGFAAIAGAGVISLLLFNIGSQDTHQITSLEITEETNASIENTGNDSDSEADTKLLSEAVIEEPTVTEQTLALRRNETLLDLLVKRENIDRQNAHNAINAISNVADLRKLRPSQQIRLLKRSTQQDQIDSLKLRISFDEEATVRFEDNQYISSTETIDTVSVTHLVQGEISDSLYLSAKRAGASDKIIIDLIRLMSFDVDFQRDVRSGDRFSIYYTRSYAPEFNDVREDEILSASLTLRGNQLDAIAYTSKDGETGYYDTAGKSTQKALMKTPVEGARLSSRFGRRKHPILGYTRLHKGLDFAAPRGTPIMAAGNGTIEMATRNGSFGNYIRIRHGNSYKTAYAHLKSYARGIKKGAKVKQGQIIGYIGTTGRSTGPHLHYEVLLAGKQVNPQSLKLPTARTLEGRDLEDFQKRYQTLVAEIEQIEYFAEIGTQNQVTANNAQSLITTQ
ncbi:peptidoglycan DD-metalloendopeptidase family protein [Kordiimonas sp. SCSIO 12610]|uniref:M23 family metallopeptidase n=1 Tax=Kordiimonas sp. SCSIO 12610 TaxID=2829597 RepID=UPI00210C47A4|nr:peptidoglycan DD-metalloendopeptidase family protein [Kordiimonas sp. SCSIO 12610]UTW55654.1 peptidoglycan DD-metalloendopeptidase family protein [Kordiimonas sp. SCSIO 12610]